jgi:hypothetical protein
MATIARLVVEISAKTAEFKAAMQETLRATRDTQRQLETSANAVKALEDRFNGLKRGFRTGVVGEQEFANAMKTLKADVAELATQGTLTEKSLDRLAKVGAGATRELNNVTRVARQTAQGFEAVGLGVQAAAALAAGGISGISGAASALSNFARGNPYLIGILGGLTALAAAWGLLKDMFKSTADEAERALSIVGRSVTNTQRIAAMRDEALRSARALNIDSATAMAPGFNVGAPATRMAIEFNRQLSNRTLQEQAVLVGNLQRALNQLKISQNNIAQSHDGTATGLRADDLGGITIGSMRKARSGMVDAGAAADLANRIAQAKQQAGALASMRDGIEDSLTAVGNLIDKTQARIASASAGIGDVMQGMFERIGGILAAGHLTFKTFLMSIVGTVAGVMVALGKQLIAFGTAGMAIKAFVKNPAAALAAGAALVLLGSTLGAAAAGTVDRGLGSGGGGGGVTASAPALSSSNSDTRTGTTIFRVPRSGFGMDPNNPDDMDRFLSMLREAQRSRRIEVEVYDA